MTGIGAVLVDRRIGQIDQRGTEIGMPCMTGGGCAAAVTTITTSNVSTRGIVMNGMNCAAARGHGVDHIAVVGAVVVTGGAGEGSTPLGIVIEMAFDIAAGPGCRIPGELRSGDIDGFIEMLRRTAGFKAIVFRGDAVALFAGKTCVTGMGLMAVGVDLRHTAIGISGIGFAAAITMAAVAGDGCAAPGPVAVDQIARVAVAVTVDIGAVGLVPIHADTESERSIDVVGCGGNGAVVADRIAVTLDAAQTATDLIVAVVDMRGMAAGSQRIGGSGLVSVTKVTGAPGGIVPVGSGIILSLIHISEPTRPY